MGAGPFTWGSVYTDHWAQEAQEELPSWRPGVLISWCFMTALNSKPHLSRACNDGTGKVFMYQQVISSYTYTTSSPPTQMHTCLHTRARATPPCQVTLRGFSPYRIRIKAWLSTLPAFAQASWPGTPGLSSTSSYEQLLLTLQNPLPGSIWEHSQEARKNSQTSQVPLLPATSPPVAVTDHVRFVFVSQHHQRRAQGEPEDG